MRPARILVVDDDKDILEFVSWVLRDDGHQAFTAPNGAVALAIACASPAPDLILLDMHTPVMDGWEFASAYRASPGPHAPIIVFTASHDAERSAAEIKAQGFLPKPFQLDDLVGVVRHYVGQVAAGANGNHL